MKRKGDTLIKKIILYNNISIIVASVVVITIVTTFIFNRIENDSLSEGVEIARQYQNIIWINGRSIEEKIRFFSKSKEWEKKLENLWDKDEKNISVEVKDSLKKLENFSSHFLEGIKVKKVETKTKGWGASIYFSRYIEESDKKVYHEIPISTTLKDRKNHLEILIPVNKEYINYKSYQTLLRKGKRITSEIVTSDEYKRIKNNYKIYEKYGIKYRYKKGEIKDGESYEILMKLEETPWNLAYIKIGTKSSKLFYLREYSIQIVLIIIFLLIILNYLILGRLYKKILAPFENFGVELKKLENGSKIFHGQYGATRDINEMENSIKNSLERWNRRSEALEKQKSRLQKRIAHMKLLEKLLLKVNREDLGTSIVDHLMETLVSQKDFDFDRGIYFEYSGSKNKLIGRKIIENSRINNGVERGKLRLRKESMKKLLKIVTIDLDKENIFARAFNEGKVVKTGRRGINVNLGCDLLYNFGLGEFIILPIYSGTRKVGCILIDNYFTNRKILQEEVGLITSILRNSNTHYKISAKINEKVEKEKEKVSKILKTTVIEPRTEIIKELLNKKKDSIGILEKIKRENAILFDYSKKKEYNFKSINFNDFIRKIVKEYQSKVRDISIGSFIDEKTSIKGDEEALTFAFKEILDNAADAISSGYDGRVKIVVEENKADVEIKILDNGIGFVDVKDSSQLFAPFKSTKEGRLGLGLTIAKRILSNHKGSSIDIKSGIENGTEVKIIMKKVN